MNKYSIGLIQLDTQDNLEENLNKIKYYIEEASTKGCKLVALPENSNYIGKDPSAHAENIPDGKTFNFLANLAIKNQIWIHAGSIYEKSNEYDRPSNTSFIINPKGELMSKYVKLHPFDVTIENGPTIKESNKIMPGEEIVVLDTKELGTWGMSICYDMRFPELYRLMVLEGAEILFVPSNFTINTGKDHWETLLRARAIENGAYVIAAAQIGKKPKFQAYAKSLVVDPWGDIIAKSSDFEGLTTAEINLDYVKAIRQQVGTLENRRIDRYKLIKL
ncbi:carbon-nitrogen hydrolase family protein [Anaerosphaera multitolerans]|uniref:Carbon-nitrogen hydrolase family protein n=1 Tax=Anaerosphaera multitolerans TaxID=2487351 RepID=A0A437S5A1_9FIRM|nr:carbon-nitrogen hydrolase family protein [Anaerosphaera multitolerans]RVU54205.1 carbon-nitrogen hydrolase family protein [Anaerosphaera multitolerans]